MDKVVKILEQYVQWLVLVLAVGWVSWQGYSYLVKDPVVTQLGSKDVTPATVDQVIRDTTARHLEGEIAKKEINPPQQAKVLEMVRLALLEQDANPVELAWLGSGSTHAPSSIGNKGPEDNTPIVKELPHPLPAAMPAPEKVTTRWTVISVPAAGKPATPAAGAAPGVPVQPVMLRQDVAYFSGIFTVDSAALTKEFNDAYSRSNVPPNLLFSEFVRVELIREEKTANGAWSAPVIIPTLPIFTVMPDPREQKPALATDKLKAALYVYKTWFEENQAIIIHPPFYQTAADAEAWVPPGGAPIPVAAQPGQVVVQRPFDPARDIPRTPEEIGQKNTYEANLRAARAARNRGSGVGPPVRPGSPPSSYTPPPGYVRPGAPTPAPGYARRPGGPPTPRNDGAVPQLINPNQGQPNVNAGLPNQDVEILVHDTSIQEGKTYRYAARYRLFNPMWDHPLLATPEIAATFDIPSPDATNPKSLEELKKDPKFDATKLWTADINVEPRSHIFVTKIDAFGLTRTVDFVVYTWKDGKWKETPVKKQVAGDAIVPNKTPTPWTVVDVRKDTHTGQTYVILMDDHGVLTRRDEASDSQSPELQKLKTETGAAAAAR